MNKKILKTMLIVSMLIVTLIGLTGCKMSLKDKKARDELRPICGTWGSNSKNSACFVFEEDKTFYWYKSESDKNDNYYKGTIEYLKGTAAMDELKLSYSGLLRLIANSKGEISVDNVYCLKLSPTYLISSGVDKTDTVKGKVMKLLFVYIDKSTAQAYNYNTGDVYDLVKK